MYCKQSLENKISEVEEIFKTVIEQKGQLIKKTPVVSYSIDLNEMINFIQINHFKFFEIAVIKTMEIIQKNQELNKILEVESNFFDKINDQIIKIHFLDVKNQEKLDSFMNNLIDNLIIIQQDRNFLASVENLTRMVNKSLLEKILQTKEFNSKKNKI